MSRPFRVLGAGPSGLAAAITLAAAGREVEVHERRADCGARFGGDLQGLENWSAEDDALDELAGYGIATDFHLAPFRDGVQTNGRRADRLAFPRPAFYLVKRGVAGDTLDQALKRQALAAGARIRFRSTLAAAAADADVVATGPRGRAVFAVDRGIVFDTDAPDLAAVLLNDRAALKGYSYLLVTGGYGCLCTMLFDEFPSVHERFETARRMLLRRFDIRVSSPRPVGGVGHFAGRPRWRTGSALHVGEAAGLQDFLWGFGIRTAIRSGVLAARALLGTGDYETEAARRLEPGLRASVVSRLLWELARHGEYRATMAALRWGGPYALIRWLHRHGPIQRLLYPAARAYGRRTYPHLAF